MKPEYIIIHHSGNPKSTFKSVDEYHRSKGWGGCGYHYFIEKSGKVYQGREENEIGAHCKSDRMNYKSIGICLAGDFTKYSPNGKQMKSLEKLVLEFEQKYKIDRRNNVLGHNEVKEAKTACPGFLVFWIMCHRLTGKNPLKEKIINLVKQL